MPAALLKKRVLQQVTEVLFQTVTNVFITVTVRFSAIGSAPILRIPICKISSKQRFEAVVSYLRRTLRCGPTDSLILYINQSFAPALDEIVGNLHRVCILGGIYAQG